MSQKLHDAFIEDATYVREALANINVSQFTLRITISGRTLSDADECKIEYFIDGSWRDSGVAGDSVESCLSEFKRRKGWTDTHAPLALAKPRAVAPPEEDIYEEHINDVYEAH